MSSKDLNENLELKDDLMKTLLITHLPEIDFGDSIDDVVTV